MKPRLSVPLFALLAAIGSARAEVSVPLASHRAAYEISLSDTDTTRPPSGTTPVAASGLIAYEFRGSSCEGYASNFHQLTELQRNEGDPISSDLRALTFEDADGKNLKFQIDSQNSGSNDPPVAGAAARADGGATTVELIKPSKQKVEIGQDILFPTQHVEHIISKAKQGGGTFEARVYDGSDTGKKVFVTLTVIGKEETKPGPDAAAAQGLEKVRRWPVSVSYFDEAARDAPPEYILSFDLYENGVSGTLKLDYGAFALTAKLAKLEWLPTPACATK
jgi:hypothetical protein